MTPQQERYVGIAAGALAVIGALLPWASIKTVFGSISRNGVDDGGDGLFTLSLGIIGALALWQAGKWLWAAAIAGVLIVVIGIVDINDVQGIVDDVNAESDGFAAASVGAGLYLTVVAGVVLAAVPALQLARARREKGDASPKAPTPPPSDLPPPIVE